MREQAALIKRMAARIAELEALVGKPKKTSANSHIPPSQDGPGGKAGKAKRGRHGHRALVSRGRSRPIPIAQNAAWPTAARIAKRPCRRRRSADGTATITSTCPGLLDDDAGGGVRWSLPAG